MIATRKRLNTALPAQGAEFLVLGNLLMEGIETHKSYTNHPGYDLVAINADTGKVCRISVKSRYASDYDGGFPIKSLDCDFVVLVALNRGCRYGHKLASKGVASPIFYVVPVGVLAVQRRSHKDWYKAYIRVIEGGAEQYQYNWSLIGEWLS